MLRLRREAHRFLRDAALGTRADAEFRRLLGLERVEDALLTAHAPRLVDLVMGVAALNLPGDPVSAGDVAGAVLLRVVQAGPRALDVPVWMHLGNEVRDRTRTHVRAGGSRPTAADASSAASVASVAATPSAELAHAEAEVRLARLSRLLTLRPLLSSDDWTLLRLLLFEGRYEILATLVGGAPTTVRKRRSRLVLRVRRLLGLEEFEDRDRPAPGASGI